MHAQRAVLNMIVHSHSHKLISADYGQQNHIMYILYTALLATKHHITINIYSACASNYIIYNFVYYSNLLIIAHDMQLCISHGYHGNAYIHMVNLRTFLPVCARK